MLSSIRSFIATVVRLFLLVAGAYGLYVYLRDEGRRRQAKLLSTTLLSPLIARLSRSIEEGRREAERRRRELQTEAGRAAEPPVDEAAERRAEASRRSGRGTV